MWAASSAETDSARLPIPEWFRCLDAERIGPLLRQLGKNHSCDDLFAGRSARGVDPRNERRRHEHHRAQDRAPLDTQRSADGAALNEARPDELLTQPPAACALSFQRYRELFPCDLSLGDEDLAKFGRLLVRG